MGRLVLFHLLFKTNHLPFLLRIKHDKTLTWQEKSLTVGKMNCYDGKRQNVKERP